MTSDTDVAPSAPTTGSPPPAATGRLRRLPGLRPRQDSPASVKATCHGGAGGAGAGADAPVVALAGAPNVGKSTLFNGLTGARVTTGNWPGTTVDVSRGVWRTTRHHSCDDPACTCPAAAPLDMTLVDLPGAYSIDPMSPDEQLTRDLLVNGPADERPDVTVVTVDAAHLARSLYLVAQLRETTLRLVVAVTMLDVAAHRGVAVDTQALASALGCPVVEVDPRRRVGVAELSRAVVSQLDAGAATPRPLAPVPLAEPVADPAQIDTGLADLALDDDRFAFVEHAIALGTRDSGQARATLTERIDRWVTAPVTGPLIFLGVMWAVFQVTTTVAAPLQDALDAFFSGPVSSAAHWLLVQVGLGNTFVDGLVVNGLIAGVGMLLTFAPLMALMFVLLALLEDSGYMARAAVVTDRMMRRLGLPGRAFLPLVVGFGCNVPAISATRVLGNVRQRVLTVLLVPFTSCTARLTVYVLVATTFFGRWAGTVVFVMYVLSIAFVVLVGLLLRRTLWRTMGQESLVIDLPPYQRPTWRLTASVTWVRLRGFLHEASGIIVVTVTLVWLAQSIPTRGGAGFGHVAVADSLYGVVARGLTPVFHFTGFASWQTVSALVVGFVAKEAVISSWGQTYALADPNSTQQLGDAIRHSFAVSSQGHVLPAVMAFLVFLLAYTPCVATLAAQKREVGVRWTLFGVALQLVVAMLAATITFQVGSLWW